MSTGWHFAYYLFDRLWGDRAAVVFLVQWPSVPREFNPNDLKRVIQRRIQGAP